MRPDQDHVIDQVAVARKAGEESAHAVADDDAAGAGVLLGEPVERCRTVLAPPLLNGRLETTHDLRAGPADAPVVVDQCRDSRCGEESGKAAVVTGADAGAGVDEGASPTFSVVLKSIRQQASARSVRTRQANVDFLAHHLSIPSPSLVVQDGRRRQPPLRMYAKDSEFREIKADPGLVPTCRLYVQALHYMDWMSDRHGAGPKLSLCLWPWNPKPLCPGAAWHTASSHPYTFRHSTSP